MDANGVMSAVYDPVLRAIRVEGDGGSGGAVNSVNGQSGTVVLVASDVGADPAGAAQTVDDALDAHLTDTTDAHDASAISFVATGTISSTDVQAAIAETASESVASLALKAPLASPTFTGTVTVPNASFANAALANVSTSTIKGRATAGTGAPEDLTATQVKTILAIANTDVSGLGTLSTQNGTFSGTHSGTSSGTNTGDQTITLTGDVTGTGTGSFAATIASHAVTNAKSAQMVAHTYKGNNTGSTADPIDVTLAQLKTELNLTGTNSGDQTITLTGDVTGSGTGSFAATIANSAVTLAKIADQAQATFLMRAAGAGTGAPIAGTATQAKTALAIANTDVSGLGTASTVNTGTSGANVPTVTLADARYAPIAAQLKATAVKTANYTAAAGDYVPLDTTSGTPIVVTLPTAPADGTAIGIKWVLGANATSTYATGGSDTLNKTGGSTSGSLVQVNQEVLLRYALASGVWYVQTSFSKGGLDALYAPIISPTFTGTPAAPTAAQGTNTTQVATTAFVQGERAKRVTSISSNATPTFNTDTCDLVSITALATAITSMVTNKTGTPTNGQHLEIRIKDNASPQGITMGADYVTRCAIALPTTTVASKLTTMGFEWDSVASKWGMLSLAQEA